MFAGSDDGFVAMYDGELNFEKDWKAEVSSVNLNIRDAWKWQAAGARCEQRGVRP